MAENNDFALGYAMGNDSNSGNDLFGGGGWGGLIGLLIVASLFGNGGWGFGGGFGGGGGMGMMMNGIATRADINEGFALQNITNSLAGITNGLCDGFHNQTVATMQGFTNLGHQISDCCCTTQRAIDGVNYNLATQACDTRNLIQNVARDITDNANANTRQLMDFLVNDKISTLTAENQALKFAASQANQNAFITANQEAQTAEIIRRLGRDCPVPAYVVPNPNCCYGNPTGVGYGYGNGGCGCGC